MGKQKQTGKVRTHDKWYKLAKDQGYRSRASWKLIQINEKHDLLDGSHAVLDLCAAPGGWMQVAVQKAPVGCFVLGLDLDPIKPVRGAIAVQEDITTSKCRSTIKRLMEENGCRAFDLILHDGSPNIGGAWSQEAMSQNALVIDSLKLATEFLAPKGTFVTKVFRSQDYSAVLYCLKKLFDKVEVDKPAASRSTSAEIYLVGLKYKAPAKIDPQLLDVKHLFKSAPEPAKTVDVLRKKPEDNKRRSGYGDDVGSLVRKVCPATDFIWSDTPLEVLGSVTSISFEDPASVPMKDHTLTTVEVKYLCQDLGVLSKQDFKHLLKWRIGLRKALAPTPKAAPPSTEVEPEIKETEEEKLLTEMEELSHALDRQKKRAKKTIAKRLSKVKARKALGMGMQMDAVVDGYGDQELFALSSIKGKKDLVAIDAAESDDDIADGEDSENEEALEKRQESSSDGDSEEERKKYHEHLEELLDEAYENYVERKDGSTKQRKRLKEKHSKDELYEDGDDMVHSDQDSDNDQRDYEANPLMVPFSEEQTQEEIASKWFGQDIFNEDEFEVAKKPKSNSKDDMQVDDQPQIQLSLSPSKETEEDDMQVDEDKPKEAIMVPTKTKKGKAQVVKASQLKDDFEIVPAPVTDSSSDDSSSDESEDDDTYSKAEILACAKKMLRKKTRENIEDDCYNKYMFHDDKGLPPWFSDDERKHIIQSKPVTKQEVNAIRAHMKEIDARPSKKVIQAKARKQRVRARNLEKIRKKANTISDQADINERSKGKMIDSLYKKVAPKRPEKEYVVAKKGVQVRTGKGKVLVDARMKKDRRALKVREKRGKGKGGSKSGKGQKRAGGKGSAGGKGGYKGRKLQKG